MTFDELWEKVPGISSIAKSQLPDAISPDTKKRLEILSPFEISGIVRFAIDEIERGSIEAVDSIIRKQLNN